MDLVLDFPPSTKPQSILAISLILCTLILLAYYMSLICKLKFKQFNVGMAAMLLVSCVSWLCQSIINLLIQDGKIRDSSDKCGTWCIAQTLLFTLFIMF